MAVRTRKRGKTFSYIFEAGKSADGKRKVIEKGGYPTADDAYDAGITAYVDWKHGNVGVASEKLLFKDMIGLWLKADSANIKETTIQTYNNAIQGHILPYFKDMTVQDIKPRDIDKWVQSKAKEGLSRAYIKIMLSVIKSVFKYAVHPCELIQSNPAAYIRIPKSCPKNLVKRTIITPEHFNAIIERYPIGSPYHVPLMIAYHTGMRIGEIVGLTWDCINFDNHTIKVQQQFQHTVKKGNYLTALKSNSSYRTIPVSEKLLSELADWRMLQDIAHESYGDAYVINYYREDKSISSCSQKLLSELQGIPFVCTMENGKLLSPNSIFYHLKKMGLNSHSFRHTHATLLIESGASPKGVASRLGHADVHITQNLYTHNTQKLKQDTLDIFEKRIGKSE